MNGRKIIAASLCILLLCAVALSGCNNEGSTPDEATVTTTIASTSVVSQTEKTTSSEVETEPKTEASRVETPLYFETEEPETEAQVCTVNVEGKSYTCYTGDTINYVFYLKTPEALEDFQATTNYDSSMLEVIETEFPIAGSSVISNSDMPNMVKFNAVNLSGMDFTNGGSLISITFRVIDGGSVAIGTTLEYMDSVKSEPYVSDYKIVGDIEYSEEIN